MGTRPKVKGNPASQVSLVTFLALGLILFQCFYGQELFSQQQDPSVTIYREIAEEAGLNFEHYIGATGEFFLPEIMGSGVALFDYDGDGDLDVYFLQGALLDQKKSSGESVFPPSTDEPPGNKLFRNRLVEDGSLRFDDVTGGAGVGETGYGMGAASGDYDNDGDPDLYVTNFGQNVLYRNNGDGTFTNVASRAGIGHLRWSTSAAFLDYDLDGDLDLFVTNYVDFQVRGNKECANAAGQRDYCNPDAYDPLPDRLFRNEGSAQFVDVTEDSGIGTTFGPGLGVVCADFDMDGWIDIFVANDGSANQLWMNKGDGTFQERALFSGTAYSGGGMAEAGMGVTAGDFDNDGDDDIFLAHLTGETNTLYVNAGAGNFLDATDRFGLGNSSFSNTGFGTQWSDYDNDGRLDLFVANGAVYIVPSLRGKTYPYHQINQLFVNGFSEIDSNIRFGETTAAAGPALDLSEVSRGAAFGDIDNDGDIDIVVANNNGRAGLLLNQVGSLQHWLEVRLQGVQSNRFGMGARVGVLREGHKPLWRRAHTDGSYLSAHDPRVHFGLGNRPGLQAVVVQWPGRKSEAWDDVRADQIVTLREGSGKPWPARP